MAGIRVADYALTRNHIDGAVTRLSPYLSHGFVDVPEVVRFLRQRHADSEMSKLLQELAWREYFQHVLRQLGEGVFEDIRPALPVRYEREVPQDIRAACTGVPVIDHAVRALYQTGYLHNHARMWLASYVVHVRKVRWQAGAEWMYTHLLDGDLASNHLSWQWCAGTFASKPYLFNAENVARFAPAWQSLNTVIDRSYESLEDIARSDTRFGPEPGRHASIQEPVPNPTQPLELETCEWRQDPQQSATLVHPWDLGDRPRAGRLVGVIHLPFHQRFAWSATRWAFVLARMRELCAEIWVGDLNAVIPCDEATRWSARMTFHPGYRELLQSAAQRRALSISAIPRFTPDPETLQPSFSAFWRKSEAQVIFRTG